MRRALAAALLLLLCGCTSEAEQDPGLMPASDDPVPEGVTVTGLPTGPVGLAVVDDAVWAALPQTDEVWAGDQAVPAGDLPLRMAATPTGVWVSLIGEAALVRLAPDGSEDLRVRLRPGDSEPEGLAYADGVLWVVDQAGDRVLEVDDESGQVLTEHPVGREPRLVTVGAGATYVTAFGGAKVTRIAGDDVLTKRAGSCLSPQGLAVAAGVVWVACTIDGQVVGLDAETLEPVVELPGIGGADAVVVDGDTVHVIGQRGPTVWTIDARAQELVGDPVALHDAPPTQENVDAVLVGDELVVSHPTTSSLYTVPLSVLGG